MDTEIPQSNGPMENVADEAIHKERGDSLVRAATTASSLEAEQDSGNITKTRSKATLNEPSSSGTSSGSGPRRQETIRDTIAQTRFENVSKLFNDPFLIRGNTLRSGEDSLKLNELMEQCTNLQQRALDLETTKTTQANEIVSLKRRVKKLEKKDRSRTHKLKRLYKFGLSARVESSRDEEDLDMFRVHDLVGDEVVIESEVAVKAGEKRNVVEEVVAVIDAASTIPVSAATITDVEITLAQTLAELKSAKPKADKVVIQEPEEGTTTTTPTTIIPVPKPPQDNAWDDVQAKVEADYQLAQRLQAQKQEELTDEEKAKLFVQFLEQRRKHFAAKRAEEKRNRPPTRAQQRNIMCTYLKNMEGWKPKSLKKKSFANIKELFEKAMKRKAEAEVMEGSSKRAGEELEQESIKKQKVDKDKEKAELQSLIEFIPDEEDVAIDTVPLATKPPTIVY
ncbi:hypothetical protein Tco_0935714 [Tanacetum coccineum]